MSTPHNKAALGDIAKTVLMPGDPLRAKFIAETYLENPVCFNTVRNMLGFTGTYKGKKITVMGSGMGMPSIGIYSYELFHTYDVDNIIRIGSAGAIQPEVNLKDVIIGMGACTDSNYGKQFELPGTFSAIADYGLLKRAVDAAEKLGVNVKVGNILSSDIFYDARPDVNQRWARMGIMAVEMEAAALYMNAARSGKNALCICTISDLPMDPTSGECSPAEREQSFNEMIEIALNTL